MLVLLAMGAAVAPLVFGIKGIRDPLSRKKAITTTILAGNAIIYGFALAILSVVFYKFGPDITIYL